MSTFKFPGEMLNTSVSLIILFFMICSAFPASLTSCFPLVTNSSIVIFPCLRPLRLYHKRIGYFGVYSVSPAFHRLGGSFVYFLCCKFLAPCDNIADMAGPHYLNFLY